jgi:hypothetical protein
VEGVFNNMPDTVTISRAKLNDLPALLAVQKETFLSEAAIYQDFTIPPLRETLAEMTAEFASQAGNWHRIIESLLIIHG